MSEETETSCLKNRKGRGANQSCSKETEVEDRQHRPKEKQLLKEVRVVPGFRVGILICLLCILRCGLAEVSLAILGLTIQNSQKPTFLYLPEF